MYLLSNFSEVTILEHSVQETLRSGRSFDRFDCQSLELIWCYRLAKPTSGDVLIMCRCINRLMRRPMCVSYLRARGHSWARESPLIWIITDLVWPNSCGCAERDSRLSRHRWSRLCNSPTALFFDCCSRGKPNIFVEDCLVFHEVDKIVIALHIEL